MYRKEKESKGLNLGQPEAFFGLSWFLLSVFLVLAPSKKIAKKRSNKFDSLSTYIFRYERSNISCSFFYIHTYVEVRVLNVCNMFSNKMGMIT